MLTLRKIFSVLLVSVTLMYSAHTNAALSAQHLLKGNSTTLDVDYEIGDIAIADPSVCDFVVSRERKQIYLNPKESGKTTLTVWDASGAKREEVGINVYSTTLAEVLRAAKESFGTLDGIKVELRNNRVVLSGEVFDKDDLRTVAQFVEANPGASSNVRLAPEVEGAMTSAITKAIGLPGIYARAIQGEIVLDGVAHSPSDASRALEIAKLYAPDVKSLIEVQDAGRRIGRGEMVELDVKLMEIKASGLRSIGVQWAPGAFPARGGSTGSVGGGSGAGAGLLGSIGEVGRSVIGFVFNLIPRLNTLRERGEARMLENPSIVVKSGEKAELFSGAEVPYFHGDEVQFKEVGVKINAEPVVSGDGVDLKISATLSTPSSHIEGAVDRTSVSTSAICKKDQSVVLGGIIHRNNVTTRNRVPKGVDTSTSVFSLFASKDFQTGQSEFVIFITPRIVKEAPAAEAKITQWIEAENAMRVASTKNPKKDEAKSKTRKWR